MTFGALALSSVILLATIRVVRRWNQTGQKFAGEPDIARTFLPLHEDLLWSLIATTYLWNLCSLVTYGFQMLNSSFYSQCIFMLASVILSGVAVTFKLAFTNEDAPELLNRFAKILIDFTTGPTLVARARYVFLGIGLFLIYTIQIQYAQDILSRRHSRKQMPQVHNGKYILHRLSNHLTDTSQGSMRTIHNVIVLFLMTQSRASNIPLLLIFEIQLYLLQWLDLSVVETSTTTLLLQYMSFFAFGGTNAISSIDLSSAYNGVSGYNVLAVGILTLVSNWAGPIYWTSATSMILVNLQKKGERNVFQKYLILMTIFTACSLCFIMAACTVLRTHLFIWTVFSPKYLYSMAWTFGQHMLINSGFGSLLFGLGTR